MRPGEWDAAARSGSEREEAIARLLIERRPKVDAAADDGKTAYDLAVARGQKAMAEWLLTSD